MIRSSDRAASNAAIRGQLAALVLLFGISCDTRTGGSSPSVDSGEVWLSTRLQGQKIGYSFHRFARQDSGYRFDDIMEIEVAMLGKRQRVRSRSTVLTDSGFRIRRFESAFASQDRSLTAAGHRSGDVLEVAIGGDRPRRIPLDGDVYPAGAIPLLARADRPGQADTFDVFDATLISVIPVSVSWDGRESILLGDSFRTANRITTTMAGVRVISWLDESGLVLVEESPPGMRSERTTAEDAVAGLGGPSIPDLLRMFRVDVDTLIEHVSTVRHARLEISGLDTTEFALTAGNQRVVFASQGTVVVEVDVPLLSGKLASEDLDGSWQEYLRPSVEVQCDDPGLVQSAERIVRGASGSPEAARRLVEWVHRNVVKEPTASFPTALDVLRELRGDCNEHAVLLAGLARAVGIPATVVVGLVYLDGAFYYHAWNEVHAGIWIPVDATFGEFPAGALRLRLREGSLSEQTRILSAVGQIGIRILEFR